ncbi:energy transducer TonB [Hymenobacter norwichensis]|uniref:energy transducer TonB n=1 Tax=Hymenobacter norwichensis TaxID=223903 RepID=UPI0003B6CCDD|nr:energy transducer TonB [Hymenobacter norwichensis]
MKKYLFLLALAVVGYSASAQQLPAKEIQYFDKQHKALPSAEGADYRAEIEYEDSVGGLRRVFYPSGAKRSVTPFEHFKQGKVNGTAEGWYENGQLEWRYTSVHDKREGEAVMYHPDGALKSRRQYVAGKRQGEWDLRYPNGQRKRREVYVNDERMVGECFDEKGQAIVFFEYEMMPTFPGGPQALLQFIGSHTRYPGKAIRQGIEGKVFVSFVVDTLGQVSNVRVAKSIHSLLDAEAARVVQNLPRFEPGKQDGRPVVVSYTVPIDFTIGRNKPSQLPKQ